MLDQYTKFEEISCSNERKMYENLYEAKLECTSESGCTSILNFGCNNERFYHCRNGNIPVSQDIMSCVYSKVDVHGTYYAITGIYSLDIDILM